MNAGIREADRQDPDRPDPIAWRAGMQAALPTLFGLGAWGLVVGGAMVKGGLTVLQASAMTLIVFSGAAQLASLPLIAAGAPVWVIFVTALAINLRFIIFAVLLGLHFTHLPWFQRLYLGYISGDISVAMFLQRYPNPAPEPGKLSYLKGLMVPKWFAWQIGSLAGIFLGSAVPAAWQIGFAGTLAILCIMVPLIINSAALCGVVVAAVAGVLAHDLPYKLGLLLAVLVGMLTAMACEETLTRRRMRHG